MKRNLKIIGLAAVLALCLLLTGCYQPPDEVNNGGQSGTTSTPFFKTIEPSPTIQVTPDTIPVDVQNTIGINNGQGTAQPTQTPGTGDTNADTEEPAARLYRQRRGARSAKTAEGTGLL